jgi:hypothetical protein
MAGNYGEYHYHEKRNLPLSFEEFKEATFIEVLQYVVSLSSLEYITN